MTMPRRRSARALLAALRRDRKGATAIEYGIILGLIVVAIMVALVALGSQSQSMWGNIHAATRKANGL